MQTLQTLQTMQTRHPEKKILLGLGGRHSVLEERGMSVTCDDHIAPNKAVSRQQGRSALGLYEYRVVSLAEDPKPWQTRHYSSHTHDTVVVRWRMQVISRW